MDALICLFIACAMALILEGAGLIQGSMIRRSLAALEGIIGEGNRLAGEHHDEP